MCCFVFQEELAEGLHLIDFEQLKIENQTYNEKIEERNEVCFTENFSITYDKMLYVLIRLFPLLILISIRHGYRLVHNS